MIVVTGATGNVGRTLVRLLAEAGEEVTAMARRITGADVPRVRAVAADLADPQSLRPAFEGADALFLLLTGELLVTGDSARKILHAAKAAGIRRVVLLSSQSAATRPQTAGHGLQAREFEEDVRDSRLDWTILRPGGFASNALAWAEPIRAQRTVIAPFGDVGLPIIDPDDIAEVAAIALREPGHDGQIYELTGPELVSPRQIAAAIGDALGEPVRFLEQTREQARAQMLTFMPEPVVEGTLAILGKPTQGEQQISRDVERALGRAPPHVRHMGPAERRSLPLNPGNTSIRTCHRERRQRVVNYWLRWKSGGVALGAGDVFPARWGDPYENSWLGLLKPPALQLFDPMMVATERAEIAFAGSPAFFVREGVVIVAFDRGHPAAGKGAALVADLDEVP